MENIYTEENIKEIRDHIKKEGYATSYLEPSFHLITTLLMIFLILYFIHVEADYSILLIVALALFLLRIFMMFHDMCHRSFFPTDEREKNYKGFNFLIASSIEQWCSYPAEIWSSGHSDHHKAHGNMNEHDETRTVITTDEYDNLEAYYKELYDIFRTPLLFFLFMPFYVFFVARIINYDINFTLKYFAWLFVLYKLGSWKLLCSYFIAQYIAGFIGIMLFHLQHQVNVGYWKPFDKEDKLSKANAELQGASVLQMPSILEYFTNGIEYHNVHHMDPGVPSYKTKKIYYDLVEKGFIEDKKIGYWQQFISLGHTIFNTKTNLYE